MQNNTQLFWNNFSTASLNSSSSVLLLTNTAACSPLADLHQTLWTSFNKTIHQQQPETLHDWFSRWQWRCNINSVLQSHEPLCSTLLLSDIIICLCSFFFFSHHLVARVYESKAEFRSALQHEKEGYTIYKNQVSQSALLWADMCRSVVIMQYLTLCLPL